MTRLASRFGASNLIRRDRPLTREELFRVSGLWGISMNDACVRPEWIPPRSANLPGWCRSICGDGRKPLVRNRLTSGYGW